MGRQTTQSERTAGEGSGEKQKCRNRQIGLLRLHMTGRPGLFVEKCQRQCSKHCSQNCRHPFRPVLNRGDRFNRSCLTRWYRCTCCAPARAYGKCDNDQSCYASERAAFDVALHAVISCVCTSGCSWMAHRNASEKVVLPELSLYTYWSSRNPS